MLRDQNQYGPSKSEPGTNTMTLRRHLILITLPLIALPAIPASSTICSSPAATSTPAVCLPSRLGSHLGLVLHFAQNDACRTICDKNHVAECLMQGAIDCNPCDDDNEKNHANAFNEALDRACRANHNECLQILKKYYNSYNPCEKDPDQDDQQHRSSGQPR